jgi:hypothetical protein
MVYSNEYQIRRIFRRTRAVMSLIRQSVRNEGWCAAPGGNF